MNHNARAAPPWFAFVVAASLLAVFVGWLEPARQRPINFGLVFWLSLPIAGLWAVVTTLSIIRFGRKALWMLIGAPVALSWPVWLIFHRIPGCY
jgi:hypothetical protein